jgi:hypothetical protein
MIQGRIFAGKTVGIVAGGPSLKGVDWSQFRGFPHVAVNRALEVCPWAHILWWTDGKFYLDNKDAIQRHAARYKATVPCQVYRPKYGQGLTFYQFTGMRGLETKPGFLRHGNNSGYTAINMVAQLGAARIVLFGYDMRFGAQGESHWHSGYQTPNRVRTLTDKMLPYFQSLVGPLRDLGIEVVNASPDSLLTYWPRCSVEQGLAICRTTNEPDIKRQADEPSVHGQSDQRLVEDPSRADGRANPALGCDRAGV